ncbi:hypothetical protein NKH70_31270 [Mesorhizobium sp. M0991]|uniref:hypothetical protein n=1 Tax=unclassified Mesorhizobium TaxID=325217 RepID=UPI00333DE731
MNIGEIANRLNRAAEIERASHVRVEPAALGSQQLPRSTPTPSWWFEVGASIPNTDSNMISTVKAASMSARTAARTAFASRSRSANIC